MDSPFGMSFDEITKQAAANMQADKGGSATQANEDPAKGRSFLDMVEASERDMAKEAEGNNEQAKEVAAGSAGLELSFDEMFSEAENAAQTDTSAAQTGTSAFDAQSFDELFKQAAQVGQPAQSDTSAPVGQSDAPVQAVSENPSLELSFDDMYNETQKKLQAGAGEKAETSNADKPPMNPPVDDVPAKETKPQEPADEQPVIEDSAVNQPAAQEPADEQPATQASAVNQSAAQEPVNEQPVVEDFAVNQPAAEETGKKETRKAGGRKSKKKDAEDKNPDEKKESLPDITDDYKVDVLGEKPAAKEETAEKAASDDRKDAASVRTEDPQLSMETLFTPEEIRAFRADIRAFVRREFKQAVVGVMKELLAEFSE